MMNATLKRSSGCKRAATVVGAVLVALALGMLLWIGPADACPPGEDCSPPNFPPTVSADSTSVVVVQGQTATNTGTYSDDSPDAIAITASVGNVTKTGTNSGTWSWSLANAAPLGRQQVTITATDSEGASGTKTFDLTVTLPNGKIAFGSRRDGNWEIYTMNPDGTGQTRLTNNSSDDAQPAFSPDGRKIAFASTRDGNDEIYVMNSDGTGQTRLTDNPASDYGPAFSPDGQKIAFASTRDDTFRSDVYVMNAANGSGVTRLTSNPSNPAWDEHPSFSPDGRKIVFSNSSLGQVDIYTMNPDGTGQTDLTYGSTPNEWQPAFSPDGRKIVFSRMNLNYGATFHVYVMNSDGTGLTRLTNNPAEDSWPSWGGAVDTTPPETTIASGPADPTNDTSPTIEFTSSEPDSTFECSLDGNSFGRCSSPYIYPYLLDGQHTFQVRATDTSGNTDPTPASHTWVVDTWAPNTTIDSGPSAVSTSSASFAFSSSEGNSTFECRATKQADTPGSFSACSSPKEYADLTDGSYTFEVRATDAAGNTDNSPASHTWTVDATAPTVESTTPADGGTGVRRNTNVSATFSKKMDPSTLSASTVTLTKAGSTTPVQATVSYDEATKTLTLDPFPDNPTQKLARRTTYTAKIEGAKDLAGNPLADKVWTFKTGRK